MSKNSLKKTVFLLLSEDPAERARLLQELPLDENCTAETVDSLRAVIEKILVGGIDGLILSLMNFEMTTLKTLSKLRAFSPNLSMIVTSPNAQKEAVKSARKMKRVVILEKPFDDQELKQFCQKVKNGEQIYQRAHERYSTNQTAVIQRLENSKKTIDGKVHNISQGGAFMEISEVVESGTILKITIRLEELSKSHTVFAEVVRITANSFGENKHGIGLRFIDESEAYMAIAEKIEN